MRALLPIVLPFVVWQLAHSFGLLPDFVLPSPVNVLHTLVSERSLLWQNALVTIGEILAGAFIGITLGIAVAVSMALSARLQRWLKPSLVASQALPVFVLAPVLTIWLGYGPEPKIAMTVLLVFFPVASSLLDGLLSTPESVLDLASITKAGRWRTLYWLRFPHALSHLGAGLRIGVTYAPTGAVIGEWVGASRGLGYLMLMANARMRIELMFAALLLIIAITIALNLLTHRVLLRYRM